MKKTTLNITGMHCSSCEVMIERVLKKQPGVKKVIVDHNKGTARIHHLKPLNEKAINTAISHHGFKLTKDNLTHTKKRSIQEYLGALALVALVYFLVHTFDMYPSNFGITESMSWPLILGMGLVASISSCAAVSGGLLVSYNAKYSEDHDSFKEKSTPTIMFNLGRLASYFFFGAILGTIGSYISLSLSATNVLIFLVSIIMILLGVHLLEVLPFNLMRYTSGMNKKLHNLMDEHSKETPFFLGASTFFLPCGFTQALQIYVLSIGDPIKSGIAMLIFAIGTLPGLLALGFITTTLKGLAKSILLKGAGAFIIVLGLMTLQNSLILLGLFAPDTLDANQAILENNVQIAQMKVDYLDYYPDSFKVKVGVPVEWRVDGSKAVGCAKVLALPALGIQEILGNDIKTITFTPTKVGKLTFSCGMGMAGPGVFEVVA